MCDREKEREETCVLEKVSILYFIKFTLIAVPMSN